MILERADSLSPGMCWNRNRHLRDVVLIVRFRELMTYAGMERIGVSARLASLRNKSRIDSDADYVVARRYRSLTVSTVENEVLAAEFPDISIRPSLAYPLIARNARSTAAQEVSGVIIWPGVRSVLLNVDHAKAAFRGAPDVAGRRVDQLIERVMPEVKMIVTGRKLIQPIIGGNVYIGVSEGEVRITDIWRRYRESNDRMRAGCDVAFDHAAKLGREVFYANNPMLSERSLINDEIRLSNRHVTRTAG